MNDIKSVVAKNISELRQANAMTQLELAEKLNYSDKAVSKWEHADSIPDISVLVQIADLFGVTLDYLISAEHSQQGAETETAKTETAKNKPIYRRGIITSVSVLLVWFIAVAAFVLILLIRKKPSYEWLCFIYAVPISSIVWLVFNSIWFNTRRNYLIISILMWSVLMSVHLSMLPFRINVSLIYLLGIPGQLIILLWSIMKRKPKE